MTKILGKHVPEDERGDPKHYSDRAGDSNLTSSSYNQLTAQILAAKFLFSQGNIILRAI